MWARSGIGAADFNFNAVKVRREWRVGFADSYDEVDWGKAVSDLFGDAVGDDVEVRYLLRMAGAAGDGWLCGVRANGCQQGKRYHHHNCKLLHTLRIRKSQRTYHCEFYVE